MPGESKKTNSSAKTSEQLVEELLESVRGRDKESKKEKKHHKHKKEKKSKHKHRSRSRERKKWKKRDRSRSKSKDRHKDKKRRHRSISQSTFDNVEKKDSLREFSPKRPKPDDDRLSPVPSCSSSHGVEDDDLPAGADFQTVLEEARKQRGSESIGTSFDLSLLPCEQGQSHRQRDFDNFPVAKERSKSPGKKNESEILKKVIDEKGAGEFIPRNVLLKTKEKEPERPDSPHSILIDVHPKAIFFNIKTNVIETKTEVRMETKVAKEECGKEKIVIEEKIVEKTVEVMEVDEYGPSVPVESTMEVEKVVENLLPTEPPAEQKEEPVKTKTTSVEEINLPYKNNNEWEFTVKPLPSAPKETNEKAKKKKKESKEKKKEKRKSRSRSPDRSRSRKRSKSKEKKRRRSVSRSRERRSRSRSREVRRRSRSRDQRRARSRSYNRDRSRRRSWSRGRRSRSRSRDREECRIDKAKLLEIAKKRRAAGIFDIGDPNPKSVEDFVSYCEKLQKRQDREDRRARGEVVSDNESEIAAPSFKPYKSAAPFNDSITINIVNAVSLPTKSAEECILDTAALRVVYPVSSGQVHRENTEWQKVEKEAPLMTASTVQKNFKALSSLDAERVRQKAKQQLEQAPAFMLPPPPAPPALPLPPVPPKITAEDTLMPAPPPVPATLIIPSKEKMIIKEPEQISSVPPKNVAEVLAKRAKAQRVLEDDPNDFHAMRDLKDANEQMNTWAQLKSLPGKFTGTTGVDVMSAEELQPHDPRGNAWVRKDMFKQLAPNFGEGIGLRMMQRMGWRPGTGLGRECTGSLEPLTLDVKNDRKGLSTEEDLPARSNKNLNRIHGTDLTGKHPVSLVMEMCAKRKWQSPIFTCMETGPSHQREFVWRAVVNGVEYCSATTSRNKKDGKSIVCQVVLQSMGLVPRDPTLPVLI